MRPDEIDHVVADSGPTLVVRAAADAGRRRAARSGRARRARRRRRALLHVGHHRQAEGRRAHPPGPARRHATVAVLARSASGDDEVVVACRWPTSWGSPSRWAWPCAGIPVYFLPRFNPGPVLDAIEQRRATVFVGVPAMYRMLARGRRRGPRPDVGAAVDLRAPTPCPPSSPTASSGMGAIATLPCVGAVGEATFAEGYGMVETGGGVAAPGVAAVAAAGARWLGRASRCRATRSRWSTRTARRSRGARSASCC